jgi:hypothetical protein
MIINQRLLLLFAIQLDASAKLHMGRLALIDTQSRGIIERWRATSGLSDYQQVGSWDKLKGGVIPATYEIVPQLNWYTVSTSPTNFKGVTGIDGNGYTIDPFSVVTKNGTIRGDFLIHRDANVPGTLGCIGIQDVDWESFEDIYKRETQPNQKTKLLVVHTY